jgi:cell division protein FtsN
VLVKPDAARGGLYNVRVGPYRTRPDAERMKARLEQEKLKPFIVRP